MSIPHIVRYVLGNAWAIEPDKMHAILGLVLRHHSGVQLSEDEVRAVVAAAPDRPTMASGGAVGILPLYGTIFPRANMITENSGGTSLQRFGAGFRQLMADPSVKAVVIEADTPGGAFDGGPEMAAEILAARGAKPIVAHVNTKMASLGYLIGAAADEVVVSPSGYVGSIGVFYPHVDRSAAMQAAGEKVTLISAGEGKTDANEFEPLTEEGRAKLQKLVGEAYGMFVAAVTKGRNVSSETVRKGWKANLYGAQEAVALGLADRVATLEDTVARLSSGAGRRSAMRAEDQPEPPAPETLREGHSGEGDALRLTTIAKSC